MLLRCSTCKEFSDSSNFNKCRTRKTGHHNQCRFCTKVSASRNVISNADRCRKYYQANRAQCLANMREYAKKHSTPAVRRERNRRYWEKHKDRLRIESAERARRALQKPGQREKIIHNGKVRRALERNVAINDFTLKQWRDILAHFEHRCCYCLRILDGSTYLRQATQDHLTPLTRGGNHTASNIVPACRNCNSRKRTKTYDEYMSYLDPLQDLPKPITLTSKFAQLTL